MPSLVSATSCNLMICFNHVYVEFQPKGRKQLAILKVQL